MIAGREYGQIVVANVGYARVSTIDQNPALQLDALAAARCVKVFEDRASGARTDRAGLKSALDYVRDGDVLISITPPPHWRPRSPRRCFISRRLPATAPIRRAARTCAS
jgi:hypothetical protein